MLLKDISAQSYSYNCMSMSCHDSWDSFLSKLLCYFRASGAIATLSILTWLLLWDVIPAKIREKGLYHSLGTFTPSDILSQLKLWSRHCLNCIELSSNLRDGNNAENVVSVYCFHDAMYRLLAWEPHSLPEVCDRIQFTHICLFIISSFLRNWISKILNLLCFWFPQWLRW